MSPAAVHLAKAFQKTGNPSKALAPLEWAFTLAEGLISESRGNLPHLWSADPASKLAQMLDPDDPDQATRRDEVLKLGRERLNHVFAHPTLSVSTMLEIQNQYNPVRSAEGAWNLTHLLDPTVPEDAEHQTVLLTLAADWLDRAASGGSLKPEHQRMREQIEAQLAPPIL